MVSDSRPLLLDATPDPLGQGADMAMPRYARLRHALMQRIASGEWCAGASLPSEHSLAGEYGVAHGTLRKALDMLVMEKVLIRRHGVGTFVAAYDGSRALSHLFRLVGPEGGHRIPEARIISHVKGAASQAEVQRLKLRSRALVIRIRRVRLLSQEPIIVEQLVLPFHLFPDLEPARAAELPPHLYEHFGTRYGLVVRHAVEDLRAVMATDEEADLLALPRHAPLLEIDRVISSLDNRPIEWRVSRCTTSNYSYRAETS
jgi:GntR family transcriptional regulator